MKKRLILFIVFVIVCAVVGVGSIVYAGSAHQNVQPKPFILMTALQVQNGVRYSITLAKDQALTLYDVGLVVTLPPGAEVVEALETSDFTRFLGVYAGTGGDGDSLVWAASQLAADQYVDAFTFTLRKAPTRQFGVRLSWAGNQSGTVTLISPKGVARADALEGELKLDAVGSAQNLLPVGNTGVLVNVPAGAVPTGTVIHVKHLNQNDDPPAATDNLWWCAVVEVDGVVAGAGLSMLVPLRNPLPPGAPVSLFARGADGQWTPLSEQGVVMFDGQYIAFVHHGGAIAAGIPRPFKPTPRVVKKETGGSNDQQQPTAPPPPPGNTPVPPPRPTAKRVIVNPTAVVVAATARIVRPKPTVQIPTATGANVIQAGTAGPSPTIGGPSPTIDLTVAALFQTRQSISQKATSSTQNTTPTPAPPLIITSTPQQSATPGPSPTPNLTFAAAIQTQRAVNPKATSSTGNVTLISPPTLNPTEAALNATINANRPNQKETSVPGITPNVTAGPSPTPNLTAAALIQTVQAINPKASPVPTEATTQTLQPTTTNAGQNATVPPTSVSVAAGLTATLTPVQVGLPSATPTLPPNKATDAVPVSKEPPSSSSSEITCPDGNLANLSQGEECSAGDGSIYIRCPFIASNTGQIDKDPCFLVIKQSDDSSQICQSGAFSTEIQCLPIVLPADLARSILIALGGDNSSASGS